MTYFETLPRLPVNNVTDKQAPGLRRAPIKMRIKLRQIIPIRL